MIKTKTSPLRSLPRLYVGGDREGMNNAKGIYFYNIFVNGSSEYRGKIVVQ